MITIDGVNYHAEWVNGSLEQTADILNGDNSGRLQGNKSMYLEYVGTFFNHSGQIRRGNDCSNDEWDNLYLVLANPINKHTVKVPFNQGYMTTAIYVSQAKRRFVNTDESRHKWEKVYEITYTTVDSQWLAGGNLTGYVRGPT